MTEEKDDEGSEPDTEENPDRETVRDWIKEDLMDLLPDMLQSLKGKPNDDSKEGHEKDDQSTLNGLSAKELEKVFFTATKKAMAELREEDKGRTKNKEPVKPPTEKKIEQEKEPLAAPPKKKRFNFWGDS